MYNTPLAYFLTFTVRGSWIHGDVRGSWKRGGEYIPPGDGTSQSFHPFSESEREIIEDAIVEQCQLKQWMLHEKAICNNHIHVVLTVLDIPPEAVMKSLKSRITLRLRKRGLVQEKEKIWTQHGSTRYLFDEKALEDACQYVYNHHADQEQNPE